MFALPGQASWLACFLSKMATARFGEKHAFPNEVLLSPMPALR
jgi:hypothetical protein